MGRRSAVRRMGDAVSAGRGFSAKNRQSCMQQLCVLVHSEFSSMRDRLCTICRGKCSRALANGTRDRSSTTQCDENPPNDHQKIRIGRFRRWASARRSRRPGSRRALPRAGCHDLCKRNHKGIRGQGRGTHLRSAPRHPLRWRVTGRPWGEAAQATGQPSRPNPTANLAGVPEGHLYRARAQFAPPSRGPAPPTRRNRR